MTTTTARPPARRLDRERTETALRAAHSILLNSAQPSRVALAYSMTPEAMAELLANLSADLAAAVEVRA